MISVKGLYLHLMDPMWSIMKMDSILKILKNIQSQGTKGVSHVRDLYKYYEEEDSELEN